jgi:GAF domain-containing protein
MSDYVTDPQRLLEVASFDLFSAEAAAALDAYAARAAERLGMPIGLVSIVLDSAQFLAGRHGLQGWVAEANGTPVEWSFCAEAVRARSRYVVPDAANDPRQQDNPLVQLDGLGSYAGAPLIMSSGHVLGTCCVLGGEPREFTPAELDELQALADDLVRLLEESHRLPAVS